MICPPPVVATRTSAPSVSTAAGPQAYTSQFISLVMFGLMMSEDRVSLQDRRREIIRGLQSLPGMFQNDTSLNAQIRGLFLVLSSCLSMLLVMLLITPALPLKLPPHHCSSHRAKSEVHAPHPSRSPACWALPPLTS